jgi:hypothetical protein
MRQWVIWVSSAALAALFAVPSLAPAIPAAQAVTTYTYDCHVSSALPTFTTTERGPPTQPSSQITYGAVDLWSHGLSARPDTPAPSATTFDGPARPARVAPATPTTELPAQATDGPSVVPARTTVAAKSATGAESALSGALLKSHLRHLEKYGQAGFRELESGRFRYYGNLTPAAKQGEMAGRRLVREWDPASGATRTWHETIDRSGNIRIVRPETGGPKTHYYFDEFGSYGGAW